MARLILPIIIILFILKQWNLIPQINMNGWFFTPTQSLFIGCIMCIIMIAVFIKGKRIVSTKEFETSQPTDELLARNKSAIETHTGEKVTTDQQNKSNTWSGGSIFFFTKKEMDNK